MEKRSGVTRDFIKMMLIKGLSIEAIRCDNVKENINEITIEMLKSRRIQWEPTVPENPHQNKVAERAFRTIFNRIRFCLYESKLSRYLWRKCAHTMIYLKNRSSCKLLKKMTSYEAWTGKASDLSALHPFGIICFAKKEKTKKLDDRAIKKKFLSYEASNQYRV